MSGVETARIAIGAFDIEHGRQVARSHWTHNGQEVSGLGRPILRRVEKVVGGPQQPSALRLKPIGGERRLTVVGALSGLDEGEPNARLGHGGPIDLALAIEDIDPFDALHGALLDGLGDFARLFARPPFASEKKREHDASRAKCHIRPFDSEGAKLRPMRNRLPEGRSEA